MQPLRQKNHFSYIVPCVSFGTAEGYKALMVNTLGRPTPLVTAPRRNSKGLVPAKAEPPGRFPERWDHTSESTPEGQPGRLYQFLNRALSNPYNGSQNLGF
jgi:hypothetical protein